MKYLLSSLCLCILLSSCQLSNRNVTGEDNKELAALLDNYYEERLQFYPIEATINGDERYNDRLLIDFTDEHRSRLRSFYKNQLTYLTRFDRENLNANDQLSYDVLKRELEVNIEALGFKDNYMPLNQFSSTHLVFMQMGSGQVYQPFKTVQDYDNWLKRASVFPAYIDSAIVYFKKGMGSGYVLPKILVERMIPQFRSVITDTAAASLFYGPVNLMPVSFDIGEKKRLSGAFNTLIVEQLTPAFRRMANFLQNEYLPVARSSTGIAAIPDGEKYYRFLVKQQTTTAFTPDEIYETGLSEVKRIRAEMEKTKDAVGFKGDLKSFFAYINTDKKFTPYKTPAEIIEAFQSIQQLIQPNLEKLFGKTPKTGFEIRQTEAFRAASASAEYQQGTADGSRPGVFYVPILDATTFNITSGMQSLFLHEAIPGHHYQISLQQENTKLPKFRRFGGNNAYIEGWALYCESLGNELGLYKDPYQYIGALGDEMHRAIRLVVDVGMHAKGMTREEAIQYMMENEQISEAGAIAEIERYMAIPGQALGYKIGALKIRALRTKYEQQLGTKFKVNAFHDAVLKDGALPLEVLEKKMDLWSTKQ
ncbi:DUF885 domain-containing protein [Sediminibacterium goheungense]|uniref:Uncharacterized protein (DUF885 family) n=1 Tax=Sediminibacterium goheungense TaxID=1086393 RepID=A0A4R6IVG1_9BACT|nr:DUF885 domain-containing protein [Sediminibacterium goheungense]TDO26351.1 uncharacterized protein (DUF885 family) [Sediminibacterium goheungense]